MCPLLLRVFPRRGGHHRLEEFARRGEEPEGELTMYTWPDATLRELTDLVKEVQLLSRTARLRGDPGLAHDHQVSGPTIVAPVPHSPNNHLPVFSHAALCAQT